MSALALRAGDPARLGDYWVAGRLGRTEVYEGYDPCGQRVAIRMVPSGTTRLRRDLPAIMRVAGHCTARVIDARAEQDPACPAYTVSEFVPGPNLRALVGLEGPFGPDRLRRLAIGTATALVAIHEAGVIHRDLRPDTVLIGPEGPRVTGFGVARAAELWPAYLAPELFAGRPSGPAADVFAWGAVMLFAATGRDVFDDPAPDGVMHLVLSGAPDLGALAEPLRTLVGAALAKDPAQRPSARELLLALLGTWDPKRGSREAASLATVPRPGIGEIAESRYLSLPPSQRPLVPQTLLALIGVDDQGRDTVRHAPLATLPASIVHHFAAAGLLTVDDGRVTLRQLVLLRAWPRLHRWVAERRPCLIETARLRRRRVVLQRVLVGAVAALMAAAVLAASMADIRLR
ncbi:serine/threonine-protein kinase [Nonomuraea soli]|uniref:non-specific serine/threonine protein kinase n=1 Tax=Nonomuraea soli TaxID=1032476 RepID=A0A7W0HTU0_9ACTN|nr:serine/threonine-protein kinase [Nonomuraea soli]MBA2895076.1 serine/threonine protein kinase [Nonomuraea soli]